MTNEKPPIAPPNKAIDYMIADAMDGDGKGPLAASYQAWHQAEVQKKTPKSGTADMTAINAEVTSRASEWANDVRKTFADSQDAAKQNNQVVLNPQGILTNLMNGGGIMSVLGGILSELKPVKDFMATVTTWLSSKIGHMFNKDTPSLSFTEAAEQIKSTNNSNAAVNGMAGYVSNPDDFVKALNHSPVRAANSVQPKTMIDLDGNFKENITAANAEAQKIMTGLINEKKLVAGNNNSYTATPDAIDTLDKLPLPHRDGLSVRKEESSTAAR